MRIVDTKRRNTLIAGGILCGLFILSLTLFVFRSDRSVQRVLFFPNETTLELRGEYREIRLRADREADVLQVVRELILGPIQLNSGRVLPRDVEVRSIFLRDWQLYLDLSENVVFPQVPIELGFDEAIGAVKQTIRYNFPRISEIYVFVGGQQPNSELLRHNSQTEG